MLWPESFPTPIKCMVKFLDNVERFHFNFQPDKVMSILFVFEIAHVELEFAHV